LQYHTELVSEVTYLLSPWVNFVLVQLEMVAIMRVQYNYSILPGNNIAMGYNNYPIIIVFI